MEISLPRISVYRHWVDASNCSTASLAASCAMYSTVSMVPLSLPMNVTPNVSGFSCVGRAKRGPRLPQAVS